TPDQNKGNEREKPREFTTPKIDPIYKDRWDTESPPFDEYTAMRLEVEYDAAENEVYVFKINTDNTPLLNEIKMRRLEDRASRNQFLYGNVLVGLSLLLQDKNARARAEENAGKIEDKIEATCRAM